MELIHQLGHTGWHSGVGEGSPAFVSPALGLQVDIINFYTNSGDGIRISTCLRLLSFHTGLFLQPPNAHFFQSGPNERIALHRTLNSAGKVHGMAAVTENQRNICCGNAAHFKYYWFFSFIFSQHVKRVLVMQLHKSNKCKDVTFYSHVHKK